MTNGATLIYNRYVRPFHKKHVNKIEDIAEVLESFINSTGSSATPSSKKDN